MTPGDLIYNETYKRCKAAGVMESLSKNAAVEALKKYKNNQFSKPSKLIDEGVTAAKKEHKNTKKRE